MLSEEEAIEFLGQILCGVEYLHARLIAHFDLKVPTGTPHPRSPRIQGLPGISRALLPSLPASQAAAVPPATPPSPRCARPCSHSPRTSCCRRRTSPSPGSRSSTSGWRSSWRMASPSGASVGPPSTSVQGWHIPGGPCTALLWGGSWAALGGHSKGTPGVGTGPPRRTGREVAGWRCPSDVPPWLCVCPQLPK